jgi:hypothetical protein
VAEKKSATEWLTGTADKTHAKSGTFILFGMARYKSCARARMVLSTVEIVQQQVEWYDGVPGLSSVPTADFGLSATLAFTTFRYLSFHDTEAGSCRLCSRSLKAVKSDYG